MELLRTQIESGKKENKRIKFKTFGRRTLQVLKLSTSIVIIPAILSGGCIACGWNPYKINEKNKPTCMVSYIDSEGNKTKYETEIPYEGKYYNTITFYDSWKKLDNGSYARDIYRYKATSDSLLELVGILQTSEEISTSSIKTLISEHLNKEIDVKEVLTNEELNRGSYIEGIYYDENKDKKVLVKETKENHNNALFVFIALNILAMAAEFIILGYNTFFFENIASAFASVNLVNIESLERKLDEVTKQLQDEVINKTKKKKLS